MVRWRQFFEVLFQWIGKKINLFLSVVLVHLTGRNFTERHLTERPFDQKTFWSTYYIAIWSINFWREFFLFSENRHLTEFWEMNHLWPKGLTRHFWFSIHTNFSTLNIRFPKICRILAWNTNFQLNFFEFRLFSNYLTIFVSFCRNMSSFVVSHPSLDDGRTCATLSLMTYRFGLTRLLY
jgi:hypothetical protein